jgi:sec-independent protein translocase protein TatC
MAETITGKKRKNTQSTAEMSFWDHVGALRGHLFRSTIAILTFSIVAFLNRKIVFEGIILAPKESDFITNILLCKLGNWLGMDGMCIGEYSIDIININVSGQFTTHLSISFFVGLVLAFPYVIWEIWRFMKPALYDNEKKYSKGAVLSMTLLFAIGILFGYYVIIPLTLNFFGTYQVSELVVNQISLASYISTFISVILSIGIVFELPVFIFFLAKVGIVTPGFLKKSRRYMIVIILTIAAVITPPDIFSQILVSLPMIALYELSIVLASRVTKRQAIS